MEHPFHLRYSAPAEVWHEAMPLGNGKLGAMAYGHTGIERIQLNDDSLWYGAYHDRNNASLKEKLPEIQRLVLSGDVRRAEELILQYMAGTPAAMRHYTTLGELDIALNQHLPFTMGWMPHSDGAEGYTSDLDLMTGMHEVAFAQQGVSYRREMFISHPAQALCLRLVSGTPGAINLDVMLNRIAISDSTVLDERRPGKRVSGGGWPAPNLDSLRTVRPGTLLMRGHDSEVEFAAAVRIVCDGEVLCPDTQLLARNGSSVILYVASSTSNRSADPAADALMRLDEAEKKGFEVLKAEHIRDFSALMGRCTLDLGPSPDLTTDKRLEAVRAGGSDPALAALYYQFGRYLIVAGGREGSSPLNLQGIWCSEFMPMWDSKYTININLQMNYWPVETGNLPELHLPVMDLMEKMQEKGKETARVMYGMRGAVCHHNTDYYGDSAPQDLYMAAMPWTIGGAWMALHIWEHYLFTQDLDFLRRMYPVMRDFALFFVDFLVERDGKLVTCPSVSPENRYIQPDGYDTPVCAGPTMDNQILRELFAGCAEAQRLLGVDAEMSETFKGISAKLPQNQIGSKGQLLEWDREYPELMPSMPHISHLFACYPGSTVNWRDTPDLLKAAGRSLGLRVENGAGEGGWPLAWYINQYARMLDGAKAEAGMRRMLGVAARNFLNVYAVGTNFVFQIDGNLGFTAGIAECLLQSHVALHFLPALPPSWKEGSVRGMRARGAREVDMKWQGGKLTQATVRPQLSGPVEVAGEAMRVTCDGLDVAVEKTPSGFSFAAEGGKSYVLSPV